MEVVYISIEQLEESRLDLVFLLVLSYLARASVLEDNMFGWETERLPDPATPGPMKANHHLSQSSFVGAHKIDKCMRLSVSLSASSVFKSFELFGEHVKRKTTQ